MRRCSTPPVAAFLALSFASTAAGPAWAQATPGDALAEQVGAAVRQLASGSDLLPAGTSLESVSVDEAGAAQVVLALPDGVSVGVLSESRAVEIDRRIHGALEVVRPIGGTNIRLRVNGSLSPLRSWVATPSSEQSTTSVPDAPSVTAAPNQTMQTMALGGPVANADGQPTGALSGVVVFCAAGHGWTAGSSSWYLQRGLLLGMVEDYGNLEQLNYFVHYLYNAGATVVPFRPVSYQPIEIVLDNDDPGVTWTGTWTNSTTATEWYENEVTSSGVRYRWTTSNATETATARYTPTITVAGFYPVYCWTRDNTDRVLQTYRITHSGGTATVKIDHQRVGRGWIYLGTYYFETGTGGYVEISNQASTTSTVVADAIRFGNGMGTVVGDGPGTVSGYSREEEGQRYWAESEAGINANGLSSSIWDCCSDDGDDNVGAAARWARAMNRTDVNNDRWRRIYLEFHSNAAGCSGGPPCSAKGTVALYNLDNGATLNQLAYATLLGEKIEADMLALDGGFEYSWGSRSPNTYHASFDYGAISAAATGDEFDATILEVAFHDNAEDAANLRSAKVRDAVARSSMQSIIEFLSDSTTFPGTQVPNTFPPDPPERVQAAHDGSGGIVLSWIAGPARPASSASGDAATGYRIYRSTNGYGFGQAVDVGNVLTTTLSDIAADATVYLRVAAYNAGGESMPSETLAVRRPVAGSAPVLIVNGYDRVSRQQNYVQTIPAGSMERPVPRVVNSFDYIVQHATALAANAVSFDSCSNEAVIAGSVELTSYSAVVWILGRESSADKTFDATEQSLVTAYLAAGGGLFVTGTEIAYELDNLNAGRTFYESTLHANYVGDDSGVFSAVGVGGIMSGLAAFSFNTAGGAPYVAPSSDRIAPQTGAVTILNYSGGTGDGAGIQYDSGTYRVVMFGFPFEAIGSSSVRVDVMGRVMGFLLEGTCQLATITNFEGYADGTSVMFQNPRVSNTAQHLLTTPNSSAVSSEVAGYDGTKTCKVQWQFVDTTPQRWLRLTTSNTANVPNPAIDLRRAVRVRLRLDSGSLRVSLGVRETGTNVPIGANGGTTGTIEWLGAGGTSSGAPQGALVTGQPGVWQTLTFLPAVNVTTFTGDGLLSAANNKGVLEHLAFAVVDGAGPFTVYLDVIDQPCAPKADFDGDGDVDQEDFGHVQRCMTGAAPVTDQTCLDAKLDTDSDVDNLDIDKFLGCQSSPGTIADPACIN